MSAIDEPEIKLELVLIREMFEKTVNSCNSRRLKSMTEIDHEINNATLDPDTFFLTPN